MPVVIPNTFVGGPGNKAKANEVNANFQALANKFGTGNDCIGNDDFTENVSRRLSGLKISQVGGLRVPTGAIEDEAITEPKIQGDPNPGSDANRAVSGDHIKLLSTASLNRIFGAGGIKKAMIGTGEVTLDKLAVTIDIVAFSFGVTPPGAGNVTAEAVQAANPAGAFPKDTYELVACYIKNFAHTTANRAWALAEPTDAGANWAGSVRGVAEGTAGICTLSGSLVYVFQLRI